MSEEQTPIAVMFIHGVQIEDPDYAQNPTSLLRREFERAFVRDAPEADEALIVDAVHWAPVLEERQRALFDKMASPEQRLAVEAYQETVRQLNQGQTHALARLALQFGRRWTGSDLHWLGLRWTMVHFIGDALAYPLSEATRDVYEAVHAEVGETLRRLAERAGSAAPLCVLAHSLGTVVASDYFYDQQSEKLTRAESPVERGHTLFSLHTMGSPLGLWLLRADPNRGLDRPIRFPSEELKRRYPALPSVWANYYDPDDVIAYPLRKLSREYGEVVSEDIRMAVGGLAGKGPLAHPFYWNDRRVAKRVARNLAAAWKSLNPDSPAQLREFAERSSRFRFWR